ncbi:MAG: helix-hairpin-helix domain-containing protein [Deltaproteobacteria bacterium]
MKREVSNENGVRRDADAGEAERKRDIALLVTAVFLVVIYFTRGFYIPDNPAPATSTPLIKKTVFEIEDSSGLNKVYTSPKDISLKDAMAMAGEPPFPHFIKGKRGLKYADTIIKTGSKITINKDGSAQVGQMSGEKHIVFSIPLDINMATVQDFEALPGIGPKLAQEIVETRERLGGFKTIDDLKKVKGIGDKKFSKIMDKLIS